MIFEPPMALGRVHCIPCTPHCYAEVTRVTRKSRVAYRTKLRWEFGTKPEAAWDSRGTQENVLPTKILFSGNVGWKTDHGPNWAARATGMDCKDCWRRLPNVDKACISRLLAAFKVKMLQCWYYCSVLPHRMHKMRTIYCNQCSCSMMCLSITLSLAQSVTCLKRSKQLNGSRSCLGWTAVDTVNWTSTVQ